MSRTKAKFGAVTVLGPHNRASDKWVIDLVHSSLSLYWATQPERARTELAELRAALDFIEAELQRPEPGALVTLFGDAS